MTENKRYELKEYYDKGLFVQDNENNKIQYYSQSKASMNKVIDLLNEQDKELENFKKQLKRVYNYFMDYLEDEMSSESFSEMWDFVITDEN